MSIYFSSQVKRLIKEAWTKGFLQGVKYQKDRTTRKIKVNYVD